jgi:hypothetical protein
MLLPGLPGQEWQQAYIIAKRVAESSRREMPFLTFVEVLNILGLKCTSFKYKSIPTLRYFYSLCNRITCWRTTPLWNCNSLLEEFLGSQSFLFKT